MVGEKTEEHYEAELPNGDLDAFLSDMNQDKASYADSEDSGLDELFGSQSHMDEGMPSEDGFSSSEDVESEVITISPEVAALSADFAAMMTDLALPSLIALFVKCDPQRLQATQEQYDKLVKAYAQYLQTKQISMTPGWMLVGVIASIYATKIPVALQERKLKEKEEALARREKQLEEREKLFQTMRDENADGSGQYDTESGA